MNKLTDYGIVLLTHLAREGEGPLHSARDLAESSHVPAPTVNKLLKKLSHARLLTSHRGVNGGYTLAKHPADISVAEAITALEGPIAITECSSSVIGLCSLEQICPNRSGWRNISQAIRETLEGLSLEDIAHPKASSASEASPALDDAARGSARTSSSKKALGAL